MQEWLYHATFRTNLKSIKTFGLGGKHEKNWEFSEDNTVCLTLDPSAANDFCECADNVSDSVYNSGIVVLAVKSEDLIFDFIEQDPNMKDKESYAYRTIIPVDKIYVISDKKGLIGKLQDLKRVPSFY